MSNEKFTLGEWRAIINEPLEDDHICDVYDSNNNCICECFSSGRWGDETGISEEQKEKNMYLIAAAPEMYRELGMIEDFLRFLVPRCCPYGSMMAKDMWMRIDKIIELRKKARGEE